MQLALLATPHFDPNQPAVIDEVSTVAHMVDDPPNVTIDPTDAGALAMANDCDRQFSVLSTAFIWGSTALQTSLRLSTT